MKVLAARLFQHAPECHAQRQQLVVRSEANMHPVLGDLHFRHERVGTELEADLVVALAGRAVGDGVGADLFGDFDLALGDQRAGDRGAEEILALVQRVRSEHRKDEVLDKGFAEIVDEDFLHAQHLGLGARGFELLALAEVGGEGHHLAAVVFLQPAQDDGGVETARISEDHLLHVALFISRWGRAGHRCHPLSYNRLKFIDTWEGSHAAAEYVANPPSLQGRAMTTAERGHAPRPLKLRNFAASPKGDKGLSRG